MDIHVRRYADSLGAVGQFNVLVSKHPVHAHLLRLLCLPRWIVCRHSAENGMVDVKARWQRAANVGFTVRQSAANSTREMTMVIQQTYIPSLMSAYLNI